MTHKERMAFASRVRSLDKESLKELFDQLKAEEAPLGMIMFVSSEYAKRK